MNDETKKRPVWVQLELFPEMKAPQGGGSVSNQQNRYSQMKVKLCRTCISYNPDDETPGFGTCGLSDCQVCEYAQGCIDWRYHKIWRP